MRKIILGIFSLLIVQCVTAQAGGGRIRFTAKKNSAQANQFQIYAKNVSSSTISGVLGASLLSICVGVPISVPAANLNVSISSPIAGQVFGPVLMSDSGTTRIYTWNGIGVTGIVAFDPNVEVMVATVTFSGVNDIRPVKLMNVVNQGPSFFDNNYIAPGGIDQCDYSNPFYSNVAGDVNLRNCNGVNDVSIPTCTSTFTVNDIVLPTKFLSFFATKSDDNAKLTWTVDNEEDNSYFEVEASKDARTFNKILKVDASRNGRSSNTYNITDAQISRYNVPTVYYRIKQVEASGKITYTDVRQVNLDSKNFVAALFPNPVKTVTKLMIEAPEAAKATVVIRDAAGKAVKQMSLQLQKGTNQQTLDVTLLAAGDYNVSIISDKLNQTIKMTKSN